MKFKTFGEEYGRIFMSVEAIFSNTHGKQELENCLIVSGGHETPVIDTCDGHAVAIDNHWQSH